MEIRNEDKELRSERKRLKDLLGSEKEQWSRVAAEIKTLRATLGPATALGKRRTSFAEQPQHDESAIEQALVEREPITVVVSEKGWIRALRGTVTDLAGIVFKADDRLKFAFAAETTSKCLVFATNGRFYTLEAAKFSRRPGSRRADPPFHRPRTRIGSCQRLSLPGGAQIPRGKCAGPRTRGARGRMHSQYAQGKAGAQCRCA
jgi:topoisomerase-4 subunit A